MKLKYILLALLLIGCGGHEAKAPEMTKTDSLLIISDSVAASAEASSKVLDSVTTVTTKTVTGNVNQLTEAITNYEKQLKSTIKIKNVEKVIHDTVYIETKKSFWGKTKTNVKTKSDSTTNQTEVVDSL